MFVCVSVCLSACTCLGVPSISPIFFYSTGYLPTASTPLSVNFNISALKKFYNQVKTINGKSNNLGSYEVYFGDYKKMYFAPEAYEKVTTEDIKRVAKKYFTKNNRTVGVLQNSEPVPGEESK